MQSNKRGGGVTNGYTVSYTNNGNTEVPAAFKINGGEWQTITEASGTFENVETIQFSLSSDGWAYSCTVESNTLGINLSANDIKVSEVYTLTQDVTDIAIGWEPYRTPGIERPEI